MELQVILVLCGVGVVVMYAALIFLARLFSTTGTTYEEAVAQQRKVTTELLALSSNKTKPKKLKKANKKLARREKRESATATTGSEHDSEGPAESGVDEDVPTTKHHVEFSPPVVMDMPVDNPPNIKIRKRGKDSKVKPILVNKDDPSCVSDPSAPPSPTHNVVINHFEEIHPKDEFELHHSSHAEKVTEKEAVEKKESKSKGGKAAKIINAPEPVKEEPAARERQNSGDAPKKQNKNKKNTKKIQVEEPAEPSPPVAEVVAPLNIPQPSELTTDKLLKQVMAPNTVTPSPPATGKNKKKKAEPNLLSLMANDAAGVNVAELVRLVSEAPLSRSELQLLTDTLLNKHHDPLPQHSDWSEGPNDPMQKLKKQLAEKEKALVDEHEASQALQNKLKELRTSLNAERSRATAASRALEESASTQRAELHTLQTRLQRLLDDNRALQQDKMHLQSKLSVDGEAQAQRAQLEIHNQRLQESESSLIQQVGVLQAELNASVGEIRNAMCDATTSRDNMVLAQQQLAELVQQLQEAGHSYSVLEEQYRNSLHTEQVLQEQISALNSRLEEVSEKDSEVQRLNKRLEQVENDCAKAMVDAENEKDQMTEVVNRLEAELSELRQLKATPALNGIAQHTVQDPNEMAKVESALESLRAELIAAQTASQEQRQQVSSLKEQLRQYQDKNNELRTKNWKVVEALQTAEKALQNQSAPANTAQDVSAAIQKVQENQYTEIATILRGVCPKAAPSIEPSRSWLEQFAANVKRELSREVKPIEVKVADDDAENLKATNEQLQAAVDKYKRIIDDTEGALSRLQLNISEEEQRWAKQLADMQHQLDQATRSDSQSQTKIASLEAELRKAQASKTHSFTDSERLTEENARLMAGVSDKHNKVDNGPIQLGLEEM